MIQLEGCSIEIHRLIVRGDFVLNQTADAATWATGMQVYDATFHGRQIPGAVLEAEHGRD